MSRSSSVPKQPYRSSRAVAPLNRRAKSSYPSRLPWTVIKSIIFVAGAGLIFFSAYPMASLNQVSTTDPVSRKEEVEVVSESNAVALDNVQKSSIPQKVEENQHAIANDSKSLARGLSGLSLDQTPALVGASRGHIQCDVNVDNLAYWNDPQGERDRNFKSPFVDSITSTSRPKYITFEPDRGGWNNIRMNLEFVFIFAAATGRTLVLPPAAPLYLMNKDKQEKHKGFGDFFPLHTEEFQKRVSIMTMEEFLELEGSDDGQFPIPEGLREDVFGSAKECDKRAKSDISCEHIWNYLEASALVPQFNTTSCIVFDEEMYETGHVSAENEVRVKEFCSPREEGIFYLNKDFQDEPLIHFKNKKGWRIMSHFYGYMYFTNPSIFNYYKRFVRDFLHYHDEIYCAAGKIVLALQEEGTKRGFQLDEEGGGGYSSMHVRRGDLQYKKVKISAEEWYENLKDTWLPHEIIYIATDERNKTFFDPIAQHHDVKFLDDYWEYARLGELDGNYMGMIDTIVASRGRTFGGTFFSTFSGYINRMRGYHGMSMKNSYYGYSPKKTITHEWKDHYSGTTFSYEWPDGWIGIDADTEPSRDKF